MNDINELAKTIVKAVSENENKKPSPYDTVAEIKRIEGSTAWVRIPGGVDETPVALTIDAKEGDSVMVRVSGGRAWITGNSSAPPTDDTEAIVAKTAAYEALDASKEAEEAAIRASESANAAEIEATRAKKAADDADENAGKAKTAADSALKGLGQVEDVVGVLEWITNHGTMESQTGKTFDENNVYFIVDPNGDYVIGSTHYSLVTNPVAADIDSYYCLSIDRSIQNYVATHIVVDSEGLWIIPDSGGNKVLIATGGAGKRYETAGTYIVGKIDNDDVTLAQFTTDGVALSLGKNLSFSIDATSGTAPAEFGERFFIKNGAMSDSIDLAKVPIVGNTITVSRINYPSESVTFTAGTSAQIETTRLFYKYIAPSQQMATNGTIVVAKKVQDMTAVHLRVQYTSMAEAPAQTFGSALEQRGGLSTAYGTRLQASQPHQFVMGKYNDNQQNNAFEIGNGTSDTARSNAFTIDWDGNAWASGDIEDGQGNVLSDKIDSSSLKDHIVEASNKNGWTYRKWKSGKVEAWYNYDGSAGTFTTWVAPIRYKDVTVSIPSGIFTASLKIFPVSRSNQFWVVHASPSSATSFNVRLATVASSSLTPSFRIYATNY